MFFPLYIAIVFAVFLFGLTGKTSNPPSDVRILQLPTQIASLFEVILTSTSLNALKSPWFDSYVFAIALISLSFYFFLYEYPFRITNNICKRAFCLKTRFCFLNEFSFRVEKRTQRVDFFLFSLLWKIFRLVWTDFVTRFFSVDKSVVCRTGGDVITTALWLLARWLFENSPFSRPWTVEKYLLRKLSKLSCGG